MTRALEPLEVRSQYHRSDSLEVLFQRYKWGWAMFYIDEATGTLVVHSDWGDWVYSWDPAHFTEPTLKAFLLKADAHYITGKLTQNRKNKRYDQEGTEKAVVKELESAALSPDEVRDMMRLWEFDMGPDVFVTSAPHDVYDYLDPVEMIVYEEEPSVTVLREQLIPAMKNQIAELMMPAMSLAVKPEGAAT